MRMKQTARNSAGLRLIFAIIAGAISLTLLLLLNVETITALLLAWDVMLAVFITWVWLIIWPMDQKKTAQFGLREDPTRASADTVLVFASIASIVAVGFILFEVGSSTGTQRSLYAAVGILSIIISWLMIHTIYTLRYAGMYYSSQIDGSVDFNNNHAPSYADFAYLAFTLGMTYQVSDTNLTGTAFRKAVLKHTLLSYVFGTLIIATTINLIAGLGK